MTLKVDHLVGGYTNIPILHDITFEINKGETVGLIGLNGAGKSTTIKHIMGLLKPFSGKITLNGRSLESEPNEYRRSIGFVPETPALYPELTLKEHIDMIQMTYQLPQQRLEKEVPDLLDKFRLDGREDWFPSNFSKGMQQKVMILCALLTRPALFVIDEPFLGLDPLAIRDLLAELDQHKSRGSSILMSTHVLSTAERVCDRFIILHEGKIIAQGQLNDLRQQFHMAEANLDEIYFALTGRESSWT